MNSPNERMLYRLQRAVETQRAAREALDDLADAITSSSLNEGQQDLLAEEVIDIELSDTAVDMGRLKSLLNTLYWHQP